MNDNQDIQVRNQETFVVVHKNGKGGGIGTILGIVTLLCGLAALCVAIGTILPVINYILFIRTTGVLLSVITLGLAVVAIIASLAKKGKKSKVGIILAVVGGLVAVLSAGIVIVGTVLFMGFGFFLGIFALFLGGL